MHSKIAARLQSLLGNVLCVLSLFFFGLATVASAQLEDTGIIPTDPSINRINWARAEYGSAISGGSVTPGSTPLTFLINGVGSGTETYSTLSISAGQSHVINLGEPREIHTLQLRLWDGDNRFFRYRIETSVDGFNYEPLVDRSEGEHRSVQRISVEPVTAQYFRITGLYSSANNSFHLTDEILLIGDRADTPFETQNVVIDARENGGAGLTDGVALEMNAGVYLVEYRSGASSRFTSDSENGGRTWDTELRVRIPQNYKLYSFGFTHNKLDRFPNAAEAESARSNQHFYIYLPVAAPVYFQYPDSAPSNNRGSQTYRVSQVSGPNDSLLVRVRDAITRSLSWQERTVASWENWVTTSNRNCFGCHTQSWSSVGINDVKSKVVGVPVSDSLEQEFIDAYKTWQNPAGWVSPFHGSSHRRTQTSLWAWAVSSFRGDSFDELLPNLVNAAQWLRGQQATTGGWTADHSSSPLYSDGTPSATHTTGNIQAFMRLIDELSDGQDPDLFEPGTTVAQLRDSVRLASSVYTASGFNFGRNVRTNAQTLVGLNAALPISTTDTRPAFVSRITETSQLLRSGQRSDGGWSDSTAGSGTSTPMQSAQALYALLQIVDQDIDDQIFSGIEYLLTRQREDGSWDAPSGLSQRLVSTTWVEIALPLIFERLINEFDRDTITDLRAIGLLNGVELSWSPVPEATGYNIYRRGIDGAFRRIATNHQDSTVLYFDSDVQIETTYIYMVRWLGAGGAESADSNEASGTPSGLVCGGDSPPVILSAPVTEGLEGVLYQYQLDAEDADEGDVLSYSLSVAPEGMTIDPVSGNIDWLPSGNQVGSHFVRVWVTDQIGRFATQAYRLNVSRIFFNEQPAFVSTPVLEAVSGYEYRYSARAVDPNVGDVLRYTLDAAPDGMTVNPTTGLIRWTPAADFSGSSDVELRVTDAGGLFDVQTFSISTAANQAPQITSSPISVAPRGRAYNYSVEAEDPEGATPLEFTLLEKPSGMTIQRFTGLILWTPATDLEGTFPVRVRVTDPGGLFDEQSYTLSVPANDPPFFSSAPLENAEAGRVYQYNSVAEDPEQGDIVYALEQGPAGMSVNSTTGLVQWNPASSHVGTHDIELRATDEFGLFAIQPYMLTVHPAGSGGGGPGGPGGPFAGLTVDIHAPEPGSLIETAVDVIATIDTDAGAPDSWEAELRAESSDLRIPIGSGTGAVSSSSIGMIDPTLVPNDSYRLYITVVKGALSGAQWFPYDVRSYLKLGEFSITASDISIPLSGLELSINRRYSSLDRSKGEFGAGWRLEVPGRVVDSASESPLMPMSGQTRVFVTRPDGKRVGFTFTPYLLSPLLPFWMPAFTPDPGVTDVLETDQTVIFASGGQYWELFGPYNPSKYYLTTRERVRYTIDEELGLREARDANLNTLTFTQGAIHHSSGESLQLQRDPAGRITRITDPSGRDVSYLYDANGDLLSVTNQSGETVAYSYWEPHLLRTITLDDGTKILENFYSPDGRLIRQLDGEGNETLIGINADERTETIQDARGGITTLRYDEDGNLISRTEPDGAQWQYAYDSNFNQTSITDPLGRVSSATYDSRSNLTSVSDNLGRVTQYTYNTLNLVTSVTNPLGDVATMSYDAFGNVISLTDFSGRSRSFSYDSAGHLRTLVDGEGNAISASYSSSGRPIQIVNGLGSVVDFVYDANGNLLSRTQRRTLGDIITQYEYDEQNRVIRVIDGEGYEALTEWNEWNKPLRFTDKRGLVTTYEYDSTGNLLRLTHPDGSVEEREYDSQLNLILERDALGRVTTHTYDSQGRKTRTTYPDGSFREQEYDLAGRMTEERNENGVPTLYEYDANGQLLRTIDGLGRAFSTVYNELGHIISTTDQRGLVTQYEHDESGRLTRVTHPDGTFESWDFDGNGREIAYINASGHSTQKEYDTAGRLVRDIDELGHFITNEYDEVGNMVRMTDQVGAVTSYQHNRIGQVLRMVDPLGAIEEYSWDGNNNRLSALDANGRLTSYIYDERDRLTRISDPLLAITQIAYDAVGNRTAFTDPNGNLTQFEYDLRNRETRMTDPLGRSVLKSYDGVGNEISVVSRRGLERQFIYNELNQVVQERWLDGAVITRTKNFTYSPTGQKLTENDDLSSYAYQYDNLERLTRIDNFGTTGVPHTVLTKTYDEEGNVSSAVDSFGFSVQSTYDPRSLLATRTFDSPLLEARFDLNYRPDQTITEVQRFTDLLSTEPAFSTSKEYDIAGRVTGYVHQRLDSALLEGEYTYNPGGELLSEVHGGEGANYTYSPRGELAAASYDSISDETFQYDLAGNPTGAGVVVGSSNQILSDATYDYSYDEDGNLVQKTQRSTGEVQFFEYDHVGSLVRYERQDSGGTTLREVEFIYDVRGRRIAKTVDGVTSYYLYDEEHVWADFDESGTRQSSYVYSDRIDELLATERSGAMDFYLTDRLGSVRGRADSNGNILHQRSYRAFGAPVLESGVGDRFGFTGREYDPELGLYYYRARYYDPELGRFISQDPLGFDAGDHNLYRYVGSSPVNGRDPSGTSQIVSYQNLLIASGALLAAQTYQVMTRQVSSFKALDPSAPEFVSEASRLARTVLEGFIITSVDSGFHLGLTKQLNLIFATAIGALELGKPWEEESERTSTIELAPTLDVTLVETRLREDGCTDVNAKRIPAHIIRAIGGEKEVKGIKSGLPKMCISTSMRNPDLYYTPYDLNMWCRCLHSKGFMWIGHLSEYGWTGW